MGLGLRLDREMLLGPSLLGKLPGDRLSKGPLQAEDDDPSAHANDELSLAIDPNSSDPALSAESSRNNAKEEGDDNKK